VITVEDWALIRRRAAEGVPKAVIARRVGVSRTTVTKGRDFGRPGEVRATTGTDVVHAVRVAGA